MTNPGSFLGYWAMDEDGGTRYSKNWGNLTEYNGVPLASGRDWRGGSANFVASDSDFLNYADEPSGLFNVGAIPMSFCMGMWIRPHQPTVTSHIFGKWHTDTASLQDYLVGLYQSQFGFHVRQRSTLTQYSLYNDVFGDLKYAKWYFVGAYYNVNTGYMGVGVNDIWKTKYIGTNGVNGSITDVKFGKTWPGSYYYDGQIQDAFFDKQVNLTAAEWSWMYNNGVGRKWEDIIDNPPPVITVESGPVVGNNPVWVFDKTFTEKVGIIDDYLSLTWVERYNEIGDFEMELPISYEGSSLLEFGNILAIKSSEKLMVVKEQKPQIREDGTNLLVIGESIESYLKQRTTNTTDNVDYPSEVLMYGYVNDNVINPSDPDRAFPQFDPIYPSMYMDEWIIEQIDPQSVYDIVSLIAKYSDLGFKIVCEDLDADPPKLRFLVTRGEDRSANQTDNNRIIFSEAMGNVLESSYLTSELGMINFAVVTSNDGVLPKVSAWGSSGSCPPRDIFTNLQGWWTLDGTGGDAHTSNNDAITSSGLSFINALHNLGADFEYSNNDYLSFGSPYYLWPGRDQYGEDTFSCGAWVKPESSAGDNDVQVIMSKRSAVTTYDTFTLRRRAASQKAQFWVVGYNPNTWYGPCESAATLPVGQWSFVVAVFNADNNTLYISVNGSSWNTYTMPSTNRLNETWYGGDDVAFMIGARYDHSVGSWANFDGVIDEAFFYYGRALTHEEVVWLYNDGQGHHYDTVAAIMDQYPSGESRHEGHLDTTIERGSLTDTEVRNILVGRGRGLIADNPPVKLIEGDFDVVGQYRYGRDFFMGDKLQVNVHGQQLDARVTEIVRSYSAEGENVYIGFDFKNAT